MMNWFKKRREAKKRRREEEQADYIDVGADDEEAPDSEQKKSWLQRLKKPSRRDQQIAVLQEAYGELLDLIRSIRSHLETQEASQNKMMQSMDRFNQTLTLMDHTSRKSAQTMENLARRATESEDLLRAMLERSERRLVILVSLLVLLMLGVLAGGLYLGMTGRVQVQVVERPHIEQPADPLVEPSVAALSPDPEAQKEAVPVEEPLPEPAEVPTEVVMEPPAREIAEEEQAMDAVTENTASVTDEEVSDAEEAAEEEPSMPTDETSAEEDMEDGEEEGIFRRRGFIFFGGD